MRWEAMKEALERHLPDLARTPTFRGTCYWVRDPNGQDASELRKKISIYDIDPTRGRCSFSTPQ